jgi:hypothetical protein
MGKGNSIHKDILVYVRKARDMGWKVELTSNGHLKWLGPNGEGPVITVSKISGPRTINNMLALLKQNGLEFNGSIPRTAVGMALEDALKKKEKVKIHSQDLGEGRPECEPSEVIIRHPRGSGNSSSKKESKVTETNVAKVLRYIEARPNQIVTNFEIVQSLGLSKSQANTSLWHASKSNLRIINVGRGAYEYRPSLPLPTGAVPTPAEPTEKGITEKKPSEPQEASLMLVEIVTRTADGLLVKDEQGKLWHIKPIAL